MSVTLQDIWFNTTEQINTILASQGEKSSGDAVGDKIRVAQIYLTSGDLTTQDSEYVSYPKFKTIFSKNLNFYNALQKLDTEIATSEHFNELGLAGEMAEYNKPDGRLYFSSEKTLFIYNINGATITKIRTLFIPLEYRNIKTLKYHDNKLYALTHEGDLMYWDLLASIEPVLLFSDINSFKFYDNDLYLQTNSGRLLHKGENIIVSLTFDFYVTNKHVIVSTGAQILNFDRELNFVKIFHNIDRVKEVDDNALFNITNRFVQSYDFNDNLLKTSTVKLPSGGHKILYSQETNRLSILSSDLESILTVLNADTLELVGTLKLSMLSSQQVVYSHYVCFIDDIADKILIVDLNTLQIIARKKLGVSSYNLVVEIN